MINKKMLLSILIIGVVSVSAGAGTWAYFSDTESDLGNTFTAATLDAVMTGAFVFDKVAPGVTKTETITVTNNGNIAANSVFLELDVTDSEPTGDTEPEAVAEDGTDVYDISKQIEITAMTYDGTSIIGLYTNGNGNGYLDLDDLNTDGKTEINGANPLAASASVDIVIEMKLHADTDNEYQGDRSTVDEIITVTQD